MTNEEKAKELGDKLINAVGHTVKDRKEIIDITNEMIEWNEQQMIEKSCAAFCKVCDTKECEDFGSDTCNWLQKFKQVMKGE